MIDWTLYLVTDPQLGGGREKIADIVSSAIDGGVSVVQLRDKTADDASFTAQALHLKGICDAHGVPLFINDRLAVAREVGTHLHIGQGDISYLEARAALPQHLMIGLSIDAPDQLDDCIHDCTAAGVTAPAVIGIGPVQATATKPDAVAPLTVAGVAAIAAKSRALGIASVAIGGVGTSNAASLAHTLIDGLCVVSAIMAAASPAQSAQELRRIWEENR